MILLTKKNTTIDTPPFNTVVPMLYSQSGTEHSATTTDTVDRVYDTGYDTECNQIPHSLIPDVPFAAEYEASLDWEIDTLTNYHCNHICTEI